MIRNGSTALEPRLASGAMPSKIVCSAIKQIAAETKNLFIPIPIERNFARTKLPRQEGKNLTACVIGSTPTGYLH